MRRKKGSFLIKAGCVMILAAGALTGYNLYDEHRAAQKASSALVELDAVVNKNAAAPSSVQLYVDIPGVQVQEPQIITMPLPDTQVPSVENPVTLPEMEVPDYILNPRMQMPVVQHEGNDYIGVLEIPRLGLRLPVMSQWSYPGLKKAPCRYAGTPYLDNFVISAHNYDSHFGRLKKLTEGERIFFTDADGNRFGYEVALIETLQPTSIDEMKNSDFDLTLFTCTVGGQMRVTVRCYKVQ